MDITIDVGEYSLNIRAAGLIVHNGKFLVHRNINKEHYALIGGRIEAGEDSKSALKREIKEEIGIDVEILDPVAVIESFYIINGSKYHEVMFVHRAEFCDAELTESLESFKNVEGKEHLKYVWLDLDKLDDYFIKPGIIKEILKDGKFPVHKVWDEIGCVRKDL